MEDILTINRAKWRTGDGSISNRTGKGFTKLLNTQGYMCCLGFRCNQMGIPKSELLGIFMPDGLSHKYEIPDLIIKNGNSSNFSITASNINDNEDITPEEKEKLITKHFAEKNIKVIFKGKYNEL